MEIFGDMMGACVKVKIFFISDRQKYFIMDLNVAPQQDLWLQAPLARLRLLATLAAGLPSAVSGMRGRDITRVLSCTCFIHGGN